MGKLKRGRLSDDEIHIIESMLNSHTDDEIAHHIGRTSKMVEEFRAKTAINAKFSDDPEINDLILLLHTKYYWNHVRRQLLDAVEEQTFEYMWASLYKQFSQHEVLETDEMMIKDLVMAQLLKDRITIQRRDIERELNLAEDIRQRKMTERREAQDNEDLAEIGRLTSEIESVQSRMNVLRHALTQTGRDLKDFQTDVNKKFEHLKATREQRYKNLESSSKNFFELIKKLDSGEMRNEEGRMNELVKASVERSRKNFESIIEFSDGTWDRPFLTPEAEERDMSMQESKQAVS